MRIAKHLLLIAAAVFSTVGPGTAQSQWKVPDHIKAYTMFVKAPVFPDLKDIPGLPRVLLIGDSISMQYTPEVRRLLAAKANVYRIPDNGQTTKYGLNHLKNWLGDGNWAVIHFNFGLHDIHGKEGPQIPIDEYERNLRQLVGELEATHARLIWASTTPVPPGLSVRRESDVVAYNAVAKTIMQQHHIPVDDLHTFLGAQGSRSEDWQLPHNLHFRAEGYTEMAGEVARYIEAELSADRVRVRSDLKKLDTSPVK